MSQTNVAALRFIGLTRKSSGEDEGTHSDQRRIIEQRCEREGFTLVRIEKEHQVSGAKDWRTREIGRAIEDVKAGRADGVLVAYEDRITRERLLAAAEIWQALEDAGAVFIACDGVDSRQEGSEFLFAVKAAIAREQWRVYQKRSNAGRARVVLEQNIHGGDKAPLGYDWTKRVSGDGTVKHGPLEPNADGWRIEAAHSAFQSDDPRERAWPNIVCILRVGSRSAALKVLRNRVYLGIAYSGVYEKEGAHPALVDEVKFRRTQRLLDQRRGQQKPSKGNREGALLGGGILRCTCGRALTRESSPRGDFYRCKNYGVNEHGDRLCPTRAAVQAVLIEPVVLAEAFRGHAARVAFHVPEIDAVGVEVFEETLAEAQAAVAEIDRQLEAGEIDAVSYGKAATSARAKLVEAQDALAAADASKGWLSLASAAVSRRLLAEDGTVKDVSVARDFIKQTVRVTVRPVGSGRRVPVAERIAVEVLTPQNGIVLREVPIPDGGEIEDPASTAQVEIALHQLPVTVGGLIVSTSEGHRSYVPEAVPAETVAEEVV